MRNTFLLICLVAIFNHSFSNHCYAQKGRDNLDTAYINSQLKIIKSLYDVREFNAVIKHSKETRQLANEISYTDGAAWCEYYIGLSFFETTPVDSAFSWMHQARSHFLLTGNDKGLVLTYVKLGLFYRKTDVVDSALFFYKIAVEKSKSINDSLNLANGMYGLGMVWVKQSKYPKALKYFQNTLEIWEKLDNKYGIAAVLNSMGILFWEQGIYSTSLEMFYKALPLRVELKDRRGEAYQHNNIGLIFRDLGYYDKALEHMKISLKIKQDIKDFHGISNSLMNIGSVFLNQGQTDSALLYLQNSLEIMRLLKDRGGIASIYSYMGEAYLKIKLYNKAKVYFLKALDIYSGIDEPKGMVETSYQYALLLKEMGKSEDAVRLLIRTKEDAESIGIMGVVAKCYKTLYDIYSSRSMCNKALAYFRKYIEIKDSLTGNDDIRQIFATQLQSEYKISEKQRLDQFNKQFELVNEQKKTRTKLLVVVSVAFVALLGLFIGLIYAMKQRKLAIEDKERQRVSVELQQKELMEQRDEIERQRNLVIYQRDRIINMLTDLGESIEYARKIQQAIFPSEKQLSELFRDFFVLYLPKETVGGDFYWVGNCSGKIGFAAADCTGHGVPGGFMSMLGMSMLNDIVANMKEITPGVILGMLRENVINALRQKGHEDDSHDGMDIALCTFNRHSNELTYAGANMSIIISTESKIEENDKIIRIGKGLVEFRPDRMPIAYYDKMGKFNEISITLQPNDTVYLFTDGYADQFGGGKPTKKFGYQTFRKLIAEVKDKPLYEQKKIFYQTLEKWKGEDENQTDDILLIAIKPI